MADARDKWRDEFIAALWAQLGPTANVVAMSAGLTFRGYSVDFLVSGDDPASIDIHVGEAASGAIDDELFEANINDDTLAVAANVANWLRERT